MLKLLDVEGYKSNLYPSPKSMANSWNPRIISEVASDIANGMLADGINTAVIPSPIAKLNVNDFAVAEDPYLASTVISEYVSSIGRAGMGVVLDGAYLDESDVSRLDRTPNQSLLNEFVIRPITKSIEHKKCNAVAVSSDIDVKNYENINTEIAEKITFKDSTYIICKNIAPEDTVARIVKGHICLDGSDIVLKSAVDRYRRLKRDITNGKVSVCELDAEIENGSAFPPEKIDEALDRVLQFAFETAGEYKSRFASYTQGETIAKNAASESSVLLKNKDDILPLANGSVVAFVGDILVNYDGQDVDNSERANELAYYIRNQGCGASGFYRGYSMYEDRSDYILGQLESSLSNIDTVVFFMGTNPQRETQMIKTQNLHLPANQIAALDRIHSLGKKIIAVVSSNLSFDVTFDKYVDAMILAPLNTKYGAEAAIDIITGRLLPMGKLSNTLYRHTELVDKKQRYYLGLPNAKVGTFVGYRYYDSADYHPAYPFGFGLSYAEFQYSNLSIQGSDVVFTVKNKSKNAGIEVVQLYAGLKNSKRCRPKKELVGFTKVMLQAGASETVRIPLNNLEHFDSVSGRWLCEQGEYTFYVGSSVRDIELEQNVLLGNAVLDSDGERIPDYLQSETNIIIDRYTLEADYKLMKKDFRNIIFGTGSLCLAIAMFLFSLISGGVGIFFIAIAAILAVSGIVFFILEGTDRSKLHESERAHVNEANKESFKDAQTIAGFSTARVFADEFDKIGMDAQKVPTPVQARADNYLEYVNENLTFAVATEQFIAFAASRGYKFEENTVKEIFAAMSASRLVITSGMTNDSFAAFIKVLSEYFGNPAAIDTVDQTYVNDHSALFKTFGQAKQKTALANIIDRSASTKEKVHIAALADVTFAEMSNYFVPFARYIRNPRNTTVIEAVADRGVQVKFTPFENLWFFVNLKVGESVKNIPSYVAELASVIRVDYTGAVPTVLSNQIAQFNYYQFDFMLEKIKPEDGISEDTWKKVDSLEAFIRSSVPFVLSNRICTSLEKFYAVYNVCGGEEKESLDRALSARVIPSAIVALEGVENVENKNLTEKLDMIFGEENIEISRSSVKAANSTVL